jgi:hypothetical protein
MNGSDSHHCSQQVCTIGTNDHVDIALLLPKKCMDRTTEVVNVRDKSACLVNERPSIQRPA